MTAAITPPAWLDRAQYPFASHTVALRAGRMHYVDEGRGDAMLFVHGTPTWSFEFRRLIAALRAGYRCVAPDHLGFGLSDRPRPFAYTPEAHAQALAEFVDAVGIDRYTLVVHDFGGPIGLPLALRDPSRVARLVILNSWCWPIDDDARMARGARLLAGGLGRALYKYGNASLRLIMPSAYGDRRKLTPKIHDHYLAVFRDRDARVLVLHALARALLGSRAFYADLLAQSARLRRYPALIVWGLKDSAFKPHCLERWRQIVPQAHVVPLADAGHWPHEEEPERVIAEVDAFLRTAPPAA